MTNVLLIYVWAGEKDVSAVSLTEERTPQTDRCIEVYHETLRQRNSHKLTKVGPSVVVARTRHSSRYQVVN